MFRTKEDDMIIRGETKQKSSGAWIFPVHPKEKEREEKMNKLDSELEEVRELKKELQALKDNLTEE